MSDKARLLAQLRKGPVAAVDFLAPNVVDGGKPITRLAARKYDLVTKDGLDVREIGKQNNAAVYALFENGRMVVSGVSSAGHPNRAGSKPAEEAPEITSHLFTVPSAFDPWEDAA